MQQTSQQYGEVIDKCKEIFLKKMRDYGSAWRILRSHAITDQVFIKAQRIRTIQEKGSQKIEEGIAPEYIGIINYSVMALIQWKLDGDRELDLPVDRAEQLYDEVVRESLTLMERKNHDYGEAWREMRVSSFADLILMKLLRVKQIEDNKGKTIVSEGIDANYFDIINYAIFALIKMEEA